VAGHTSISHVVTENAKSQLSSSVLLLVSEIKKDFLLDRADVFVMPSISEPFGWLRQPYNVLQLFPRHPLKVLPGALVVIFGISIQGLMKIKLISALLQDITHVIWENSAEKVKSSVENFK
jgi:glycosyltransferase involved in cell wall biosynthesis